ncbi:HlyD family efflux transporter periplasmic adaptor subunit, partial [Acinetobacter baumannii]
DQTHAEHQQLEAAVQQAEASIKQQKALIEAANSSVHLAQLNLQRSEVLAPADGTLSNFDLRVGNYVKVGQAVAALLDRKQLYVVGYFEETKLNKIHLNDPVTVQLMGDSIKYKGHVQGIASGIEDRERTTSSGLLANVNPTFSWVRLAQRVPVKIVLDDVPHDSLAFVAGRTVTVHILEKDKK